MIKKNYIFFCAIIIFYAFDLTAQQSSDTISSIGDYQKIDEKCIWIHASQDSVFLDSLSLVPGSLMLNRSEDTTLQDTTLYTYNYNTGQLKLHAGVWKSHNADSVLACYRTLPFSFSTKYQFRPLSLYDSSAFFDDVRFGHQTQSAFPKEELFNTPNLHKSGSISRGVSFGARQDVFVNADLNLQLEGALTDDLNIRASITDQNIPLQPQGNTQQLQDFDKVLIEVYNDRFSLEAGDVLLQSKSTNPRMQDTLFHDLAPHFLRYRRNVQGGRLHTAYEIGKNGHAQTSLGASLAKGKFASVTLDVQEGVQGPYLLKSPGNNQRGWDNAGVGNAFYILANSEKVYLDGKLLKRGYDQDYVIDYNLGEITFTAEVLITKFSRVSIDFEYADRTFSRSILNAQHTQRHGKVAFYMDFYRERDNPNQPLTFELDDEDKQWLREIGDDVSSAYVIAADSITEEESGNRENSVENNIPGRGTLPDIRYVKKDTVAGGVSHQIFEYTTQTEGVYKVAFTHMGEGGGDYALSSSTVNGKVYEWVAPNNGTSLGSYAPVRLISTPKSKQVLSLGTSVDLTKKDKLYAEVAFSDYDKNLYSPLGASDDKGKALLLGYKSAPRDVRFLDGYAWSQDVNYEYRQKTFTVIDPYRSVEFERNWSSSLPGSILSEAPGLPDDHVFNYLTRLHKDQQNHWVYHASVRDKGSYLKGLQNTIEVAQQIGKLQVMAEGFLLNSRQYDHRSTWRRMHVDAHWRSKSIMPGYIYRIDRNAVRRQHSDSVLYTANNFEEHQVYLQSGDSVSGNFRVDYSFRIDKAPYKGALVKSDQSHTLNARYNAQVHKDHKLALLFTYRKIHNLHDSIGKVENHVGIENGMDESILGKMAWSGSFLKNSVRSALDYSLGNGRELKREFVYVKVPTGEGPYTWRDENGNGVEEIDEFYEARYPDERNYARVYISTGEYILAYTSTFNYRLNIQPPQAWHRQEGVKKLLGMLSANASWSIDKKTDDPGFGNRLNPWATIQDENLLFIREVLQTTFFFNQRNPRYGADYTIRQSHRKQLLNIGFDERAMSVHQLKLRYNIQKIWQLQVQVEKEQSKSVLQSNVPREGKSRNYLIDRHGISPQLAWQPGLNFRLSGKYSYDLKQDNSLQLENTSAEIPQKADASIHVFGLETRWSQMIQSALNASVEFVSIQYEGDENTAIAYEMLEALRPGNNLRWMLNWQQKIMDGLQLSVNYHGRKSPDQTVIHTGGVQVRALF